MDSNDTPKPIDYASMLAAMEAQYSALGAAIPTMRVLVSLSGAYVSEVGAGGGFAQGHNSGPIGPGEVPPGSFHGKSIPEGSVLYLRMVRQKQKSADIAAALLRGGYQTNSSDFNNQVHAALDRASKKEGSEVIKLENAYWGLREWLSPNVRASMDSRPTTAPKKIKKLKKRKTSSSPSPAADTLKPESPSKANGADRESIYKAPNPDSAEGRIVAAMMQESTKIWTPAEVSDAAGIPRVQTVHFLLGKLAFRNVVLKRPDGTYHLI